MTPILHQEITPTDEAHWLALRRLDLTSTDTAALFGLSPYCTLFELWHRKKSAAVVEFKENERMKWGGRLESSIASGICEDNGWTGWPWKNYVRLPDERLGASFDWRIRLPGSDPDEWAKDGLLEIKCIDWLQFNNGWAMEGEGVARELVAPAHIEIQVQHQLLVSGLQWAVIGAFVGGNDVRLLRREADPAVHRAILAKAREFWASIDANIEPPPVYPDDAEAVIRLNNHAEPGTVIDAPDLADLIAEYKAASAEAKTAEDRKHTAKARILEAIGDAEKARCGRFTVNAGITPGSTYTVTREPFRNFRITEKKGA